MTMNAFVFGAAAPISYEWIAGCLPANVIPVTFTAVTDRATDNRVLVACSDGNTRRMYADETERPAILAAI